MTIHHGSMTNGHYTAYVRHLSNWFHCDDALITPASEEAVKSCEAYMLFYIQKQLTD